MRCAMLVAAAGIFWLAVAGVAPAQTALEKLEKEVARQVAPPEPETGGKSTPPSGEPGYLGIIADDRGENGRGVRVLDVDAGGPAARAGLKRADLITEVDGLTVGDMQDFAARLEHVPAGGTLALHIERDGESRPLKITLGRRPPTVQRRFPEFGRIPDPPGTPAPPPEKQAARQRKQGLLGVWVEEVTADKQIELSLPAAAGALITRVTENSPADHAGLAPDDVIVAIDGERLMAKDDLKRLLTAAGPGAVVRLTWYRGGQSWDSAVRLRGAKPSAADSAADAPRTDAAARHDESERIRALERRVDELERRLAELERLLEPPPRRPVP